MQLKLYFFASSTVSYSQKCKTKNKRNKKLTLESEYMQKFYNILANI